MECNKDEAIRAKEIAEKKMQNSDFEAARKIALRARNLHPGLENITQLLCICDVHCSAQNGQVGSDKDWYGILQIEKTADEPTVKKQYRRLALILHPDKNRFPGAESAFKLVCEANALLTDPARKSLYDSKMTVHARSASVNPLDKIKKSPKLNKQKNSDGPDEVFWTSCPFCKTRYQYRKEIIGKSLCCPTCRKNFVAYEISVPGKSSRTKSGQAGGQDVPPKPDSSRSAAVFHEKMSPVIENRKIGVQKGKKRPPSQGIASKRTVGPKKDVEKGIGSDRIEKDVENLRTDGTYNTNTDSNNDATRGETRDSRKKSRKRVRRESSETESKDRTANGDFDAVEIENHSDEDIFYSCNSEIECPDPEFSDFDKARDEARFAVGQFWACYDNILDGMPRFYARVKKVNLSPFELSITWLEAVPVDESYVKWVDEGLPVGCGCFKLGKTEKSQARLSFSHQVHFEKKKKKRGSLLMYPREGEVWALFDGWDIEWSLEPENHKEFKYCIVEVVSDFVPGFGIRVVYLDRITGFVSIFERASCQSFVVRPDEVYKFSHCVPCFKMSGSEREGVPIGSFELDPASLPLNLDDLCYSGKAKTGDGKSECY